MTTNTSRPAAGTWKVLSQHLCQGWLEGYLLTGRHGVFTSYEAFIHIVDSMVNQHAKCYEAFAHIVLNYPLTSHVCVRTTTARRIRIGVRGPRRQQATRGGAGPTAGRSALMDDATIALG